MPRRSFREILRKGRRNLHEHMQVPALYIAAEGAVPVPVQVRDMTAVVDTADQGSKIKGYAKVAVQTPRILFFRSQLENARNGAIFSIAEGEAYQVERTEPANDITRIAEVSVLPKKETEGLPVPDANTVFPPLDPDVVP